MEEGRKGGVLGWVEKSRLVKAGREYLHMMNTNYET